MKRIGPFLPLLGVLLLAAFWLLLAACCQLPRPNKAIATPHGIEPVAGTRLSVEGTVTQVEPPDDEDTFGLVVIDNWFVCLFDEHEQISLKLGQKIVIRGEVLCLERTGRLKLITCRIVR